MQVLEFSRDTGFAVGLSLTSPSVDAFLQELRQVKAALLEWKSRHGARCEMVMLTVHAPTEHHSTIESLIDRIYREEGALAPLLQSLNVQVALLNMHGTPVKEYAFSKPVSIEAADAKPWWQCW